MIKTKERKLFIFSIVFIALTAAMIFSWAVMLTIWQFWPYDPIRVDTVRLDKYEATHGEKVCFFVEGKKFLDLPAKVSIELVDGEAIYVMSYNSQHPPGTQFKGRCFLVPLHTVPKDTYVVRWIARYQVNPIREVVETKDSDFIKILGRDNNE